MGVKQFCSALIVAVMIQNIAIAHPLFSEPLKEDVAEKKAWSANELRELVHDGETAFRTGRYQEAIAICSRAVEGYEAINDISGMPTALLCLGISYHSIGEYDQAVDYYEQVTVLNEGRNIPH